MGLPNKTVWAGGGVLWKPSKSAGVKVALVHRRRYNDWSLPKGKSEPGEILPVTAAREIVEETGYQVRLGHHLETVSYRLNSGTPKQVGYWAAEAVGGDFVDNDECDDLRWLSIPHAIDRVSYDLDADVLRTFASRPVRDLHTMLVVRHAWAGVARDFDGDDRDRPLDECGVKQAAALRDVLGVFGAEKLHAADRARCIRTLHPLANALGATIRVEPTLSEEAFAADPDAAYKRLRRIGRKQRSVHAVCSQGSVIPPVLSRWANEDGVVLPPSQNLKGSVWVLTMADDTLVAADHIPSPLG